MGLGNVALQLLIAVLIMGCMPLWDAIRPLSSENEAKSLNNTSQSNHDGGETPQPRAPSEAEKNANCPHEENATGNDPKKSEKFFPKWIWRPLRSCVRGLHEYDGVVTAIATAVIAAFTVSLAVDSGRQAEYIKGQLSAMQADQRPWLRPRVVGLDPFVVTEKEISFGITLEFFNTGKSPAVDVEYAFDFLSWDYPRAVLRQQDHCKFAEHLSAETDERRQQHRTIFPNENGQLTFGFPYQSREVGKFDVSLLGPPNSPITYLIAPTFIGCIAYRPYGSRTYYHTWFAFDLGNSADDGSFTRIIRGPQTIEAGKVRTKLSFTGRNTAD
jgi:hypothetical protein